jgi:5-(carboxyamino)imidazole ribonucleotide mutase
MQPLVSVVMGSKSDWDVMAHCSDMLEKLGVPCEVRVLSAHRTPDALFAYLAEAEGRGVEVFIAAAGGAAHLAGVVAAKTLRPVLGVPMESKLQGLDSLLSMVQMPAGIPVGTLAVGKAGAVNAALFAAAILANKHDKYREALRKYREEQAKAVLAVGDPRGGAK